MTNYVVFLLHFVTMQSKKEARFIAVFITLDFAKFDPQQHNSSSFKNTSFKRNTFVVLI